jgi:hypothetical protein
MLKYIFSTQGAYTNLSLQSQGYPLPIPRSNSITSSIAVLVRMHNQPSSRTDRRLLDAEVEGLASHPIAIVIEIGTVEGALRQILEPLDDLDLVPRNLENSLTIRMAHTEELDLQPRLRLHKCFEINLHLLLALGIVDVYIVLRNDECQLLQELTHSQRAKQEPNGSIIARNPRMRMPRDNERVEITKIFQMARMDSGPASRIWTLLLAFERHPDRDVLNPVHMMHIDVVEECSRNDSSVDAGETELVLAVEDLRSFGIDALAGAQKTEVEIAMRDQREHTPDCPLACGIIVIAVSGFCAEFDGVRYDQGVLIDPDSQLGG